jgi:hypothetical protein
LNWDDAEMSQEMARLYTSLSWKRFYASSIWIRRSKLGLPMDKVAPGQVFHWAHQFSPVSTFPSTLHTHSFIHSSITSIIQS